MFMIFVAHYNNKNGKLIYKCKNPFQTGMCRNEKQKLNRSV